MFEICQRRVHLKRLLLQPDQSEGVSADEDAQPAGKRLKPLDKQTVQESIAQESEGSWFRGLIPKVQQAFSSNLTTWEGWAQAGLERPASKACLDMS